MVQALLACQHAQVARTPACVDAFPLRCFSTAPLLLKLCSDMRMKVDTQHKCDGPAPSWLDKTAVLCFVCALTDFPVRCGYAEDAVKACGRFGSIQDSQRAQPSPPLEYRYEPGEPQVSLVSPHDPAPVVRKDVYPFHLRSPDPCQTAGQYYSIPRHP